MSAARISSLTTQNAKIKYECVLQHCSAPFWQQRPTNTMQTQFESTTEEHVKRSFAEVHQRRQMQRRVRAMWNRNNACQRHPALNFNAPVRMRRLRVMGDTVVLGTCHAKQRDVLQACSTYMILLCLGTCVRKAVCERGQQELFTYVKRSY